MLTVENTNLPDTGSWYITTLAKLLLADASSVVGKAVDILQNSNNNRDFGRRMRLWLA